MARETEASVGCPRGVCSRQCNGAEYEEKGGVWLGQLGFLRENNFQWSDSHERTENKLDLSGELSLREHCQQQRVHHHKAT